MYVVAPVRYYPGLGLPLGIDTGSGNSAIPNDQPREEPQQRLAQISNTCPDSGIVSCQHGRFSIQGPRCSMS